MRICNYREAATTLTIPTSLALGASNGRQILPATPNTECASDRPDFLTHIVKSPIIYASCNCYQVQHTVRLDVADDEMVSPIALTCPSGSTVCNWDSWEISTSFFTRYTVLGNDPSHLSKTFVGTTMTSDPACVVWLNDDMNCSQTMQCDKCRKQG